MSGKTNKKLRASIKQVSASKNTVLDYEGTRRLSQTSMKYLTEQMKQVYKNLSSSDRGRFFSIMQADVDGLVKKYQT